MKPGNFHSLFRRWSSLILIILSLSSYTSSTEATATLDQAEETSEERDQPQVSIEVSAAIQAPTQFNLSFQSFLLDVHIAEIEVDTYIVPVAGFILSQSKGFKILLRQFIATNAP